MQGGKREADNCRRLAQRSARRLGLAAAGTQLPGGMDEEGGFLLSLWRRSRLQPTQVGSAFEAYTTEPVLVWVGCCWAFPWALEPVKSVTYLQGISRLCSVSGMDDLCLAMLTENLLWALLSSFSLSKEKARRQTDHLCCVLQLQSLSQPL